jgi:hypothetical protein
METPDTLANLLEDIVCPGLDEPLASGQDILTPDERRTIQQYLQGLEDIYAALRDRAAMEEQNQLVLEMTE